MEDGDVDTMYAYYCFHQLHILPSEYNKLDRYEKAVVIQFIDKYAQEMKKEEKRLKK